MWLRMGASGRWWLLAAGLLLAGGGCAPPPTDVSLDSDPFGPLAWTLLPTQGRPALLKIGGRLPVLFRVPSGFAGRAELHLIESAAPDRPDARVPLTLDGELQITPGPPTAPGLVGPAEQAGRTEPPEPESLAAARAVIPDDVRPGLYDLVIALYEQRRNKPLRVKVVPRSVALYERFGPVVHFVQLSNMNVGSATAPEFSDELVEEVNRIAPAFIITTGDYTEWANVRNDADSWRRVKKYFARFEAPVFLTAGDLDHEASFQQFVAPSRSGHFFFGPYHGILLYDNYRNPIDRDGAQVRWLDAVLKDSVNARFHFLVSPNDSLRIFDAWRQAGHTPKEYVRRHRIGMIFVGGYSDWDFIEHAAKRGDVPIHYIRTHASSTCARGKATGVPHYRIVRVEPGVGRLAGPCRVTYALPENGPVQHAQHSVPVGRLKVAFDRPNDGSAERVKVTVHNRLTVPIPQLRVKVNLKASGRAAPAAVGGQIERVIQHKVHRQVWLRIDCPDLGVASAVVGPAKSLPTPPAGVVFKFLGDPVLQYRPAKAPDGFQYYLTDGKIQLQMKNVYPVGSRQRKIWPIIRLNGNLLSLRGVPAGQPITLAPDEQRTIPVNTPLGLAAPGEHWLTVHLPDDPLPFQTRRAIELIVLAEEGAAPGQPPSP